MHPLLLNWDFNQREALRTSAITDCYSWAHQRRWMQGVSARDPGGFYSDKGYPWVREVQNSAAPNNYIMKGAQVGLTECGINRALYELFQMSRDVLYVLPTKQAADVFSKTRFKNATKFSRYMVERIVDTVDVKQCGSATLYVRGAKNDINLKSVPVSVMILDEVDELEERQLWLAQSRLSGHDEKFMWAISTPTTPNWGVHKLFLSSTQEHFVFKCPSCSQFIELAWGDGPNDPICCFEICGESVDDVDCARSRIRCHLCDATLPHRAKSEWLQLGGSSRARWQSMSANSEPDQRGFTLNQFYSSTVSEKEIAVAYHRGLGNEEANREFFNSVLGQPYLADGSQISDADIDQCLRGHTMHGMTYPKVGGGRLITMGIDQGKYNHWSAVEWAIGAGLPGDVNDKAKGRVIAFGKFFGDDWAAAVQLMRLYQVMACVIDARPDIAPPRRFARGFPGYVWLCDYVEGKVAREMSVLDDEFGAHICKIDRTSWTSAALGRIMTDRMELPRDLSLEFRQHLKGLVRTYKKTNDGGYVATYQKIADDHFAHTLVYNEVALKMLDPSLDTSEFVTSLY